MLFVKDNNFTVYREYVTHNCTIMYIILRHCIKAHTLYSDLYYHCMHVMCYVSKLVGHISTSKFNYVLECRNHPMALSNQVFMTLNL